MKAHLCLALKAWALGLITAGAVVLPLQMVWDRSDFASTFADVAHRLLMFFLSIPTGLIATAIFGTFLTAPLFVIAFGVSVLFVRPIATYPKGTTVVAGFVTIAIVAGLDAATRDNQWANSRTFWEKFVHIALSWDAMVFALPVLRAAYYFATRIKAVRS